MFPLAMDAEHALKFKFERASAETNILKVQDRFLPSVVACSAIWRMLPKYLNLLGSEMINDGANAKL